MRRLASAIPAGLAAGLAAALALGACGAPRAVLIPAPPSEVRREIGAPAAAAAPASRGDRPQETAAPGAGAAPGTPSDNAVAPRGAGPVMPERLPEYIEAYEKTLQAIARGAAATAAPSWAALEDSKWGTDAVFNQGVLFQIGGDLDAAAEHYRRAADRSPAFQPPLANLLGLSLLRGDRERMTFLLARILPPGTPPPPTLMPELALNAAAALMETGRGDDAALLLRALRARGNGAPALAWNLAVLSYRSGDLAAARDLAKTVSPGVATLYPVVASRFAWAGEGDEIPALGPAPAGMSGMASLAANLEAYGEYRAGHAEAAEKTLAPVAAGTQAPAEIVSNVGLLQAEQGRWEEARRNLERAVRENPALPSAWLNLGIFREVYEGNAAGARECYEKYVRLHGSRKEEVRKWADRLGQSAAPRQ